MRFNKLNLSIACLFVLGFILIMLNFLTVWLNLAAISVFVVAGVLLSFSLFFSCRRKNAILNAESEEIIMELAVEEGMETYIPKEKKTGKIKELRENLHIYSPFILSCLLTIALITLLVLTIIKL